MTEPATTEMPNASCCRKLREALHNDAFPMIYDDRIQEVQILLSEPGGIAVVHYCPFCGAKLESGRSLLFTPPTEVDREDVRRKLGGLATVEQVMRELGEPDTSGTGGGPSTRPWARWSRYSHLWSSLVLTVGEHHGGGLSWAISGRPASRDYTASNQP